MCVGKLVQSDFNILKFGNNYNLLQRLEAAKDVKEKERGRRNDNLMKLERKKNDDFTSSLHFFIFLLKKNKIKEHV